MGRGDFAVPFPTRSTPGNTDISSAGAELDGEEGCLVCF